MEKKSTWQVLSAINCNSFLEKKNGLTYLSWAHAWGIAKEKYSDANYRVINYDGKPYLFDSNLGYLVTTEITIDGETIPMNLPVMDGANKAQKDVAYEYETKYGKKKVEAATMFDINTAIMRCLTKNLAMFGLGHYIYAGEDLPISSTESVKDAPISIQDVKDKLSKITNLADLLTYHKSLENNITEEVSKLFTSKKESLISKK
jgi:hypothetical protein